MTRKSKRRSEIVKETKNIRKQVLSGKNPCVSFVKDGRFQNQDIGEFDNPSENDTGECNLERYHDLSYQRSDSYHSSDEEIVLFQGRRLVRDHLGASFDKQQNIGDNNFAELPPPRLNKHFSSRNCYPVFEEKGIISRHHSPDSGDNINNGDASIDDYIDNLREFDEFSSSKLLHVPNSKILDNQAEHSTDESLTIRTDPANHECDIGFTMNLNCTRNVGYKNQDASTYDLSKDDVLNHELISKLGDTDIVPASSKKQCYSDNENLSFAEEVCNQRLSSLAKSPRNSTSKQGRTRRNESMTEDWLLENLGNATEKLLSEREELIDNHDIPLSVDLNYINRKFDELNIVEPDLEASLRSQWRLDRSKKAKRKREREELRVMGMLGRKQKVKYKRSSKSTKQDLKKEMQLFLSSNEESQSLPPLGRAERKFVHELAHAFGLKSRSIGQGISRHPIVYKTATSMRCFDGELEPRSGSLHRVSRFKAPKERVNGDKERNYRRRGGLDRVAVGYREGEIVGAAAPELAAENVGNQLMRKLGWKPGEALGAQNNKGILQPVAHVVKNSRSGLG